MEDSKIIQEAIDIISESVITPVIYLINTDDHICFVCFLNPNTVYERVINAQEKLSKLLNSNAVILDIREFDECDRVDILEKADMIYCADSNLKKLFEMSLLNDCKRAFEEKSGIIDREKSCDSMYLN